MGSLVSVGVCFPDKKGIIHVVWATVEEEVVRELEALRERGGTYEEAERFLRCNKLAKEFVKDPVERLRAMRDPDVLASAVSQRLAQCSLLDLKRLVKSCIELEQLLGVDVLSRLSPQALMRVFNCI